ncbi:IclR family transcriptional regulator [Jatrophihabitans sp.]|uniref:IclR family transcriptional regulator n=1 Tax=Jatrophihabitans sp. TaxID=1932789 RepID=UPI0030C75424|nr:transcriptional regulator, IclR family [Jatrophihabitans sp.]
MAKDQTRDEQTYQVPALSKAIAVLEALRVKGELTITEVGDLTGINKSTTYYLMQTLLSHRLIEQDDRRYRLGLGLLHFAAGVARRLSPVEIMKSHLAELQPKFDASFVIYRRVDPDHVALVDQLHREHGIHITVPVGSVIPIQGGSFGRCFLAHDSLPEIDRVLDKGLTRYTKHSVTDPKVFRAEILATRERGWAVDREGFAEGVTTVAAPVVETSGAVRFVIGAVGFASLMTDARTQEYGQQLHDACIELASLLDGANSAHDADLELDD